MFRMHKRPPENGSAVGDSEIFIIRRMLENLEPYSVPQPPAHSEPPAAPTAHVDDEGLAATKRLVCEQRRIAEVLLKELTELEERLQRQPELGDADTAHVAAWKAAESIEAAADACRERLAAASSAREASSAERIKAEEFAAAAVAAENEAMLLETQAQKELAGLEAELGIACEEAHRLQEHATTLRRELISEAAPQFDRVAKFAEELALLKP